MKNSLNFIALIIGVIVSAQTIHLTQVKKVHNNTDKFFYKIDSVQANNSEYLGEIEVSGFSNDDVSVFNEIYRKAKTISANSYSVKYNINIEGKKTFNNNHYFLKLYYTPKENFVIDYNKVFIFSEKETIFRINNEEIKLGIRSYYTYQLKTSEIVDLSTRKIFGSRLKLVSNKNQPELYYMTLGAKIKSNENNTPGIIFKTGDIIKLEKSFAQFLLIIYSQKIN